MTAAEAERAKVVAWLRAGGTSRGYEFATLGLRLRAAWNAFRAPWALPRAEAKRAATAIEARAHLSEGGA